MRLLLWVIGLSLCACGRVDAPPEPSGSVGEGGRAASAGSGASAGSNTHEAGTSGIGAGEANGGAPSGAAGNLASAGGKAAVASGGSGTGGAGGAAGVSGVPGAGGQITGIAGAPPLDNDDMYDACGCGCCGVPLQNRCYYPELGESLSAIKVKDQATHADPGCANAGCSIGVHYVRCETADVEQGATYTVVGYADNKSHLRVNRTTLTGRCTALATVEPGAAREGFPLELPGQNGLMTGAAMDGPCNGMPTSTTQRTEIGALGFMKQAAPHSCAFDLDFTLFFLAQDGTADGARFKAEGIALPGMANSTCP